ncbi:hypothetical protein CYY_008374 [Polysphondylium violaceum]|uniref:Tetratricopeptide-like helical domain-containing protein n=1 Tax=Polysphondylium violaceum TaxID=133409 RepID=A0A8J4UQ75_9MYCE|nr:hypothetical protein CYY_008374 [Polysphondylium violaceum]
MNKSITPLYRLFNSIKQKTSSNITLPMNGNHSVSTKYINGNRDANLKNHRIYINKYIFNRNNNNNSSNNIFNNSFNNSNNNRTYITTTKVLFNQNNVITQVQDNDIDVQYKSLIDNALEEFKTNNIQSSLNSLNSAIELCANKADAYILRGDINLEILKNLEHDSFSDYCKALEFALPTSHIQILFSIAKSSLLKTTNDNQSYLSYLEKVLFIDPNNELSRYILNGFYLRSGDYQQALDNIEKLNGVYKFLSLGDLALGQKNYEMAIEHYKKALQTYNMEKEQKESSSVGGTVYHNKFVLFNPEGHQRIIDKDQSTYLSPLYHVYNGLGVAYQSIDKLKESYECFKKLSELEPTTKFGYKMQSFLQFTMGNFEQALQDIKKAIHLDTFYPTNETESNVLSKIDLNLQLGMYGEAAFELDRMIQISLHFHPWDSEAIEKRAIYFTKLVKIIALVLNHAPITDPAIGSRKEIVQVMKENFPDSKFNETDLFRETPDEKIHNFLPYLSMYSKIYKIILDKHAGKMDDQTKFNLECRYIFFNYAHRLLEDSLYLAFPSQEEIPLPTGDNHQLILDIIYDQEYNERSQALVRQELHNLMIDLTKEIIKATK